MQALRLARTSALRPATAGLVGTTQRRCLATATANHVDVQQASAQSSTRVAPIPLSNVEAHWERLGSDEKVALHEQLELVQQKDWKELSLDEKKAGAYKFVACCLGCFLRFPRRRKWLVVEYCAHRFWIAYFVAFGPHGPRTPTSQPGDSLKIFLSVAGLVGLTVVLHQIVRRFGALIFPSCLFVWVGIAHFRWKIAGQSEPKTMSKEWQEASNERAIEQKLNPISGTFSWVFVSFQMSLITLGFFFPPPRYRFGGLLRKRFRPIEIEGQYPIQCPRRGVINQGSNTSVVGLARESCFFISNSTCLHTCLALKTILSQLPPPAPGKTSHDDIPLDFYLPLSPFYSVLFAYAIFLSFFFFFQYIFGRRYAGPLLAQQESSLNLCFDVLFQRSVKTGHPERQIRCVWLASGKCRRRDETRDPFVTTGLTLSTAWRSRRDIQSLYFIYYSPPRNFGHSHLEDSSLGLDIHTRLARLPGMYLESTVFGKYWPHQ